MTKLYVYKEQSIGRICGEWYEAFSGLANRGWGGIHQPPTTFNHREIRPAKESDLKTFKLAKSSYYEFEDDVDSGINIHPAQLADDEVLPNCSNGCGKLTYVAMSWHNNKRIVTAGCDKCRSLFDTQDGNITRTIKLNKK